ncbi:hypothetical protein C1H46_032532 [Malus baccata]|uniref:Secreted protein n=1 Tax=Malus baccata TaxID=106549 RepID=A0A540KGJ2_MALBA|nr:hypothetical protein C1H46_041137 [Malus baccata]TQD81929.1 hypothetical protein C1H46_032532 [Malus baccata]
MLWGCWSAAVGLPRAVPVSWVTGFGLDGLWVKSSVGWVVVDEWVGGSSDFQSNPKPIGLVSTKQ